LKGVALACDNRGNLLRVMRDDLGLTSRAHPGQPLATLLDRGNLEKVLDFLSVIRAAKVALDWEFNVTVEEQLVTLHFAGADVGNELLIAGGPYRSDYTFFLEQILPVNNEQSGSILELIRSQGDISQKRHESDLSIYDEISRLNNELVALQRDLSLKNIELSRLNVQKNQFLGIAAHDLRNPLGGIIGYTELLLDETVKLDPEYREILTIIHRSGNYMLQLINDLLDITKIESGTLVLDLVSMDLADLVRRNVSLNQVIASRKGIRIEFTAEAALPEIQADAARLEQILNNLIGNAVKYSGSGSVVKVDLKREGDQAIILVSDCGLGIPPEQIDTLFKPFATGKARGTAGEKSTGLGLAIVRKIVSAHGGEIRVQSEVGKGSTFEVSLPIKGGLL
jgi:signal transduction histidine kinase